ncbi:MAG: peptidoglycan-binding domain-containing protein, partial [Trebonia sp.]
MSLSVGTFGEPVAQLHAALAEGGYQLPPAEVARRFFGPGTLAAVRAVQRARGLTVTGMVDSATQAAVTALRASQAPPEAAGSVRRQPTGSSAGQPSRA